ncbi:MAG: MATE family efflux transporter [Bacteroidia bacterium]|nr:MAG: MATE family efflux transporter [Bacteroidia bacterium]
MFNYSYKDILKIVLPLVVSGFGQSVIYVTDTLFLGRLGEVALGASAIAGLFYATLMMIGFGISSGLQVLIAQKYGEGKREETNLYLLNGIFIQLVVAVLLTILYFIFQSHLITLMIKSNELKSSTMSFLGVRVLGFVPYFLFYSYRAYYLGTGETKIISLVIVIMSVLNLILNPLLIYGYAGIIPALDYVGSAWASVIAEWAGMFFIMIFYSYRKNSAKFISYIQIKIWKEILTLSLPLIFQHFISVFSWFLFFVFIEKMGSKELAVSNIIRAVYVLLMAPILAFSHTTVTITGQIFGSKEYGQLKNVVWRVCLLSVIFTLPFSIVSFFKPTWLMQIFTNNDEIMTDGIPVMKLVAFALLYFSVSLPWLSGVTGIGKTRHALMIELISFVVYITVSYVFVFVWQWTLPMVWLNEFVYFTCIMGMSYWVFSKQISITHLSC